MPISTASLSAEDAVKRRSGDLIELSHSIHAEPELAFAEDRSCAKTQALAAEHDSTSPRHPAAWTPRFAPTTAVARW
jgi:metal-dependent amidase/aminoacylase/carboxypeptidase family protein